MLEAPLPIPAVIVSSWRSGVLCVGGSCSWAVYVVCGWQVCCLQLGSVVVGLLYVDLVHGQHTLYVRVDGWGVVIHQGVATDRGQW